MRSRNSALAAALVLSACVGGPRPDARGYDEIGAATWYGDAFAGRPTASGARFDPAALTAAHRTLPLGTVAEVTSLDTGRSVRVVINDRGPGDRARLIDLSRAAADALGGDRALRRVRVRAIGTQRLPAGERRQPMTLTRDAVLQVAAFASEPRARALAARLGGFVDAGGGLYRVRLGPFATAAEAQQARDAAARAGYADAAFVQPN